MKLRYFTFTLLMATSTILVGCSAPMVDTNISVYLTVDNGEVVEASQTETLSPIPPKMNEVTTPTKPAVRYVTKPLTEAEKARLIYDYIIEYDLCPRVAIGVLPNPPKSPFEEISEVGSDVSTIERGYLKSLMQYSRSILKRVSSDLTEHEQLCLSFRNTLAERAK